MKHQNPEPLPERYSELQDLVRSFEKDFVKFYHKGNKEAGIRLRKNMQTLRAFARTVRDEVQHINAHQETNDHTTTYT
jgi:hypothetical protein